MKTVDRNEFMVWLEGYFIKRDANGFIAPNEAACEAAHDAVNRGEKIALTVDNEIVSYIISRDDGFYEEIA